MWLLALKYKTPIIISLILLSIVGYIWFLNSTITELEENIKGKEVQIVEYLGTIELQNAGILEEKRQSTEREVKAAKQLELVQKSVEVYKTKAAKLLVVAPSNPDNLCESANNLINQELSK